MHNLLKNFSPVIMACDIAFIAVLSCLLTVCVPAVAYAYVDPSVLTYTIQVGAGIAVAIGAVAGVAYRRVRKKMCAKLGIDTDAGKVCEPDISRIDVCRADSIPTDAAREFIKQLSPSEKDNYSMSLKQRIPIALAVGFCVAFSFFFAMPLDLVAGNETSLVYTVHDIVLTCMIACLLCFIIVSFILCCIRGKAFAICCVSIVAVFLMGWVQSMFFNQQLMTVDHVFIIPLSSPSIINAVMWAAALIILIGAPLRYKPHSAAKIAAAVALMLVIVQGAGVVQIFVSYDNGDYDSYYLTQDGIGEVSEEENVIVFVLDTYDTGYLIEDFESHPDLKESLSDFTWYEDSAATMCPTRYAIPYFLTGSVPSDSESLDTYISRRYASSTLLSDMSETGYEISIYADSLGEKDTWVPYVGASIENVKQIDDTKIDFAGCVIMSAKTSMFRIVPYCLKNVFKYYTPEINQLLRGEMVFGTDGDNVPYAVDDAGFSEQLREQGLTFNDEEKSFKLLHFSGAHCPYTIDENADRCSSSDGTLKSQCVGDMRIVIEYIEQMKEMGIYDDATIIITADHGVHSSENYLSSSPIFLIKRPHQHSDTLTQIDDIRVDSSTLIATIMASMGDDSGQWGIPVWNLNASDNEVRTCWLYNETDSGDILKKFEIKGSALKQESRIDTGIIIE